MSQAQFSERQVNWRQKVQYEKDQIHKRLKAIYPKIFVELELEPTSKHQSLSSSTGVCWAAGSIGSGTKGGKNAQKFIEEEEDEWDDT
jgi:hypothetical protein